MSNVIETVESVVETTTVEAVAKPAKEKNVYPFMTKKQIVQSLAESRQFAIDCLFILCNRQTSDELEKKETFHSNRIGLRCSEATWAPNMAQKLSEGEPLTDIEWARLDKVLPVYRKQLAAHFRDEAVAKHPELAEKAQVFFTA